MHVGEGVRGELEVEGDVDAAMRLTERVQHWLEHLRVVPLPHPLHGHLGKVVRETPRDQRAHVRGVEAIDGLVAHLSVGEFDGAVAFHEGMDVGELGVPLDGIRDDRVVGDLGVPVDGARDGLDVGLGVRDGLDVKDLGVPVDGVRDGLDVGELGVPVDDVRDGLDVGELGVTVYCVRDGLDVGELGVRGIGLHDEAVGCLGERVDAHGVGRVAWRCGGLGYWRVRTVKLLAREAACEMQMRGFVNCDFVKKNWGWLYKLCCTPPPPPGNWATNMWGLNVSGLKSQCVTRAGLPIRRPSGFSLKKK